MKKRVVYCDVLRFFAILSVIMIHVMGFARDIFIHNDRLAYFAFTAIDSFTRAGVPIFFMISGIFMLSGKGEENYWTFFKKRVVSLFIPFFIISILYYLYYNHLNGMPIDILDFINLFSTAMVKYHLWFMYDILAIYLLIPFFRKMVKALSDKELLSMIIVIFIFGNCLNFINTLTESYFHFSFMKNFIMPNTIIYSNYLFLGYYLFHIHKKSKYDNGIYLLGIISLMLMPFIDSTIAIEYRDDFVLVARSMLPFIMSTALFIFVKYHYDKLHIPKFIENFCTKNVSIVFYVYMLHVFVLDIVRDHLLDYISPIGKFKTLIFSGILFILTSVITIVISYILNKLITFIKKKLSILLN